MAVPPPPLLHAWHPSVDGVREAFEATFVDHAYPPHTHAAWTLFLVDAGGVVYDLDGRPRIAPQATASLLPPHLVHDGRPTGPGGYRMRVIYLAPEALPERLIGPSVDQPALGDPGLAAELGRVHEALRCAERAFEAEVRLHLLLDAIGAGVGPGRSSPVSGTPDGAAEAVRAYLDEHLFASPRMREVAAVVGASPAHLARSFRATFGITPHAYREGRRIEAARDRILRGQPLADVAAELGYVDQAHLTRRFRQFLGTTPGRFARGA